MTKNDRTTLDGFSLIEISMALLIIGLAMGLAFKGTHLIETMQLKSVVKMVETYRMATRFFEESHGALPGDFDQASQHLNPHFRDGNGNGIIESQGLDPHSEAFWFWQHLSAAGFIPFPGHVDPGQRASFGHGVPAAKTGGGFTIQYRPFNNPSMPGHWIILGKQKGFSGDQALLTPTQAGYILKQLGEGDPTTGPVRILPGTDVPPNSCLSGKMLNYKTTYPACIMAFQLGDF